MRHAVAVVLSVSLLETEIPVLRTCFCVGYDNAKQPEYELAMNAFLGFFGPVFLVSENLLNRRQATKTQARYRGMSDLD